MIRRFLAIVCLSAAAASSARAHKPSDSYLRINGDADQFTAEWGIAVRDLELLVGLDSDQDGKITWGELKRQQPAVAAHALSHLSVRTKEAAIPLRVAEMKVTQHSDGAYAVLSLESDSSAGSSSFEGPPISLEYGLLFEIDPTHRGLVLIERDSVSSTHILSPESRQLRLDAEAPSLAQTLVEYVGEGVWHIWIGFDHILFLITLLLPAVLVRAYEKWTGVESLRTACVGVLRIVTMFTLAHSITLWLSVMEYAQLPSQWVEATIALSIIVTAVSNLFPKIPLTGSRVAFIFGLIHGFGFANVLVDLGLRSETLAVALLGFNVGVELGQIAIVLAFLPLAYVFRETRFYRTVVLQSGSIVIALIAGVWLYERVFNAEILGF